MLTLTNLPPWLDISSWNVAKATLMNYMFNAAVAFNTDLSLWNVARVTTMEKMFHSTTLFNGNLSLWEVSSVLTMERMFDSALGFNCDISLWDTSSVTTMKKMFWGSSFNQDVSPWQVEQVESMEGMFAGSKFDRTICGDTWKQNNAFEPDSGRSGCCNPGSFMVDPHVSFLLADAAGSCDACPAGWMNAARNSHLLCTQCSAGKSSNSQRTDCSACALGRTLASLHPVVCTICPAGMYTTNQEPHLDVDVTCHACMVGRYIEDDGRDDTKHTSSKNCLTCPKGYEFKDATQCQVCSYSHYQDEGGRTNVRCKKCPSNQFIMDDRGESVAHDDVKDCFHCQEGRYAKAGDFGCDACNSGKRVNSDITACVDCVVGRYSRVSFILSFIFYSQYNVLTKCIFYFFYRVITEVNC